MVRKTLITAVILLMASAGAVLASFTLTSNTSAVQSVPYQMNFQGRLNDSTGTPRAAGTYNMIFRIYSTSGGGTPIWSETRSVYGGTGVSVTSGGLFSVQLGAVVGLPPAIFNSAANLYLEVELPTPATVVCATNGCPSYTEGPMTPRNPIVSSPFAINTDTLDGFDSTDFAAATGSANYLQNQTASSQAASFSISGTGLIKGSSTTAFQVQNASNEPILNVDTASNLVNINGLSFSKSGAIGAWQTQTAPTGSWMGVAFGNGIFVAVKASAPYVMTSTDGITWTTRTASAGSWSTVVYGNGQFVAVSDGASMTSTDGITWTPHAAASNYWYNVSYGNGVFVATSDTSPYVMTSPDGATWTTRTGQSGSWYSSVYGNGLFVAVSDWSNYVMTSPDGVTWTARTAPAGTWSSVTYANGLFVAVGTGQSVITSPDGINWTSHAAPDVGWASIAYTNDMFVASGEKAPYAMMSRDGTTWSAMDAPQNEWYDTAYGNDTIVSLSSFAPNIMTADISPSLSMNGGLHTEANVNIDGDTVISGHAILNDKLTTKGDVVIQSESNSATAFQIQNSTGGSLFSANGQSNTSTINGGLYWSPATTPQASTNIWTDVAYGNNILVAVERSSPYVMTSPDGDTWTTRTGQSGSWQSVAYGASTFVVASYTGSNRIMTSPDGISWTLQTAPGNVNSVRYINGLFVGVSNNFIMTSPDGITWTSRTAPSGNWVSVGYGNGKYIAVDNVSANIATSPDGITWTSQSVPTSGWTDITYGKGLFVAVDTNKVMTSPDGITWTERSVPNGGWGDIEFAHGMYIAVEYNGASMTSPDGITWNKQTLASGSVGGITSTADKIIAVGGAPSYAYVGRLTTTLTVNGGILSNGTASISADSATALSIQNSAGGRVLGVDTSAGATLFGSASSSTGKLTLYNASNSNTVTLQSGIVTTSFTLTLPTALGSSGQCLSDTTGTGVLGWSGCSGGGGGSSSKQVTLTPEYAGAVLRADGSNNNGTMVTDFISGLAVGQGYKHNYYQWTTSQATSQDYTVVVTQQLPSDVNATTEFDSNSWKVWTYVDNTTDAAITMTVYDNDMTACANAVSIESGSTGWQQLTLSDFDTTASCDFTANSIITIEISLTSKSPATNKVRVGEIQYGYTT